MDNDVIILDLDHPRILRLGHKALKTYSAMTGTPMSEISDDLLRYDRLTLLLFVMLGADDKNLTPEKLDDLIDSALRDKKITLMGLVKTISEAIKVSLADPDAKEEDPLTAPAGTGADHEPLPLPTV
jgi:hypothetical protein